MRETLNSNPSVSRSRVKSLRPVTVLPHLGRQPPTRLPGGLKAELENAAADEIISSIQRDADKLEEIAKASIAKLTPDKVCGALTKAWGADQLRDLVRGVNAYLTTLTTTPMPSQDFRRPVQSAAAKSN
jgi:hypothetical protein